MQAPNSSVVEIMEIRTKHLGAGFEAGLKGLKALEIGS